MEMQIKTMRYHFTQTRKSESKCQIITSVSKVVEKLEHSCNICSNLKGAATLEIHLAISQMMKCSITIGPRKSTPKNKGKRNENRSDKICE